MQHLDSKRLKVFSEVSSDLSRLDRAEVSDVYSDEKFFFSFMDGLCQNFNKNRFKTSLTFLNAISCSKNQKLTEHSLILS